MAGTVQYDGLFIATPERVSFAYQLAGLGSRAVALLLDTAVTCAAMVAVIVATVAVNLDSNASILLLATSSFVITNLYFIFFEGLWSGRTPGKRAMRLRVVGSGGQPLTFEQALTRNLIRNIDFLPFGYGVGLVALFANGHGKRLGDLAAGSLVIRERPSLGLAALTRLAEQRLAAEARAPVSDVAPTEEVVYQWQRSVRDLDPVLRDFVVAYAGRRPRLNLAYRSGLAESARAGLERALPAMVAADGPLAALDTLADHVAGVNRPGAAG